jgi:8-oxo-dGTP diphosphatase
MNFEKTTVVICPLVLRNGKILVGRRDQTDHHGAICNPGGKLELGEGLVDGAARELLEETGMVADHISLWTTISTTYPELGKHYITIFMLADVPEDQQPEDKELEKNGKWFWALPQELLRQRAKGEIVLMKSMEQVLETLT